MRHYIIIYQVILEIDLSLSLSVNRPKYSSAQLVLAENPEHLSELSDAYVLLVAILFLNCDGIELSYLVLDLMYSAFQLTSPA